MAVAACHVIHYMMGMPVARLRQVPKELSCLNCIMKRNSSHSNGLHCSWILQEFLNHKQKALMLFSHNLTKVDGRLERLTLMTA